MSTLNELFLNIAAGQSAKSVGRYLVRPLPEIPKHRLGITPDGNPIFFIYCRPDGSERRPLGCLLELISVQFNRNCELISDDHNPQSGIYSTIELKSASAHLHGYFLNVVHLMLKSLPHSFTTSELSDHLRKIISLFNSLATMPRKSIQGLWAELLVIETAKNPTYLAAAWHKVNTDKYDFNDGTDKIEVKSTSQQRRIHRFSAEQLQPNPSSRLLIISVKTIETSIGSSIHHLLLQVINRISDPIVSLGLSVKVAEILGNSFEQAMDVYFDYAQARDSIKYFRAADIPTIDPLNVPSQIQRLQFDCDLTDVEHAAIDNEESLLFAAI